MKTSRTLPLAALALAAAVLAAGCGHGAGTAMGAPAAAPSGGAALSVTDRQFATVAAGSGMYEVAVSQLAQSRATSPQVKSYAAMLVQHHTQANNELLAIMCARGMQPPAQLPPELQAKMTRMQGLSGAAFDAEFIRVAGVQDHQTNIALHERGAREATDPDLKAWAAKTLPVLRAHLQQAQQIAGTLAG